MYITIVNKSRNRTVNYDDIISIQHQTGVGGKDRLLIADRNGWTTALYINKDVEVNVELDGEI